MLMTSLEKYLRATVARHLWTILFISLGVLTPNGASAKGFFFDLNANYMISKIERVSNTSSSFSLISTAGQVIGLKTGMELGKSYATYLAVEALTQSFVGPSTRTFQNAESSPTRLDIGFSYFYKDIELFARVGQHDFLALNDLDATTHDLQKNAMSTFSLGMALTAQSKTNFSLDAEAVLTTGLGSVEFNSDTITLVSGLTGTLRIIFGKKFQYGILTTMHINEYKTTAETYTHTDFYNGLFGTFNF